MQLIWVRVIEESARMLWQNMKIKVSKYFIKIKLMICLLPDNTSEYQQVQ
jgi:hypothetical protein